MDNKKRYVFEYKLVSYDNNKLYNLCRKIFTSDDRILEVMASIDYEHVRLSIILDEQDNDLIQQIEKLLAAYDESYVISSVFSYTVASCDFLEQIQYTSVTLKIGSQLANSFSFPISHKKLFEELNSQYEIERLTFGYKFTNSFSVYGDSCKGIRFNIETEKEDKVDILFDFLKYQLCKPLPDGKIIRVFVSLDTSYIIFILDQKDVFFKFESLDDIKILLSQELNNVDIESLVANSENLKDLLMQIV